MTSFIGGQLVSRTGKFKLQVIAGSAVSLAATMLMQTLHVGTPAWHISVFMFIFGLGGGLIGPTISVIVQSSVPQSLAGTTQGADWLGSSCGAATGPEVVHSFVAPSAGSYVFSTAGSSFDTVLSLRDEASCGELACNDDFGGQASSRLSTFLEAGQAVYVVVDGKLGASGSYALSINGSVASSCPTLALPSSVPQIVTGNTSGGPNSSTPSCTGFGAAPEHTFTFTAPATASYTFDTVGSPYDTVLYILGASCTGLQLACNDDTFGLQSQIVLALSEGQTVTIVVDGFGDQAGSYTLHIQ